MIDLFVVRNFRFFSALIFSFLSFSAITMSHYSPTIPQVSIFLVSHIRQDEAEK